MNEAFWTNETLIFGLFAAAYLFLGWKVLLQAAKNIVKGHVFDENFLMSIATIGAFAIGEYPEALAVMLFYRIGEYFEEKAIDKSKRSIRSLMDLKAEFANKVSLDGQGKETIEKVDPQTVSVGDIILIKPGEKIPLDGIVFEGTSAIDAKALTGESIPRGISPGEEALSGCINLEGLLRLRVTKVYSDSTVSRIMNLVENAAENKAPVENFISKFAAVYTPIVVGLAIAIAVLPPLLLGFNREIFSDWLKRALVFLVISCPCALVISVPLGFFAGIGKSSRQGILVKGGNYLDALRRLDTVVFDKTGTLTKGVFEVSKLIPAPGFSAERLMELAAEAESFSNHPIARAIVGFYREPREPREHSDSQFREIPGKGIALTTKEGIILAGNTKLMIDNGVSDFVEDDSVFAKVYVALNGAFAGCILISDVIKPDSKTAITLLKERGISKTIMLSGDSVNVVTETARQIGVDESRGGLLPQDKLEILNSIITAQHTNTLHTNDIQRKSNRDGTVAFVGDGINDAPCLARADIGIAMGGLGQDAAIEAADIVIMTDEPAKIAAAYDIAAQTGRIVRQNITFALSVKLLTMIAGVLGFAPMWAAVFADVGVTILATLNSVRILKK
ncbi:MAG: cadmium-translocating P-type ATPase [Spirochaetaceae bacterium]|jgi:Cd2+/Zn2+-exporting ATPase|nr:cadmium-translocating P-type ATPase [Spirochaetaceae bacterium]